MASRLHSKKLIKNSKNPQKNEIEASIAVPSKISPTYKHDTNITNPSTTAQLLENTRFLLAKIQHQAEPLSIQELRNRHFKTPPKKFDEKEFNEKQSLLNLINSKSRIDNPYYDNSSLNNRLPTDQDFNQQINYSANNNEDTLDYFLSKPNQKIMRPYYANNRGNIGIDPYAVRQDRNPPNYFAYPNRSDKYNMRYAQNTIENYDENEPSIENHYQVDKYNHNYLDSEDIKHTKRYASPITNNTYNNIIRDDWKYLHGDVQPETEVLNSRDYLKVIPENIDPYAQRDKSDDAAYGSNKFINPRIQNQRDIMAQNEHNNRQNRFYNKNFNVNGERIINDEKNAIYYSQNFPKNFENGERNSTRFMIIQDPAIRSQEISRERKLKRIQELEVIVNLQGKMDKFRIGDSKEKVELLRLKQQISLDNNWSREIAEKKRMKAQEQAARMNQEMNDEMKVRHELEQLRQRYKDEIEREKSIENEKKQTSLHNKSTNYTHNYLHSKKDSQVSKSDVLDKNNHNNILTNQTSTQQESIDSLHQAQSKFNKQNIIHSQQNNGNNLLESQKNELQQNQFSKNHSSEMQKEKKISHDMAANHPSIETMLNKDKTQENIQIISSQLQSSSKEENEAETSIALKENNISSTQTRNVIDNIPVDESIDKSNIFSQKNFQASKPKKRSSQSTASLQIYAEKKPDEIAKGENQYKRVHDKLTELKDITTRNLILTRKHILNQANKINNNRGFENFVRKYPSRNQMINLSTEGTSSHFLGKYNEEKALPSIYNRQPQELHHIDVNQYLDRTKLDSVESLLNEIELKSNKNIIIQKKQSMEQV